MTNLDHPPAVVSAKEWMAARKELLAKEKELTRMRDRVNAERRRLRMVRVDKPYAFEGRRQPVIYMAKRLARSGERAFRPRPLTVVAKAPRAGRPALSATKRVTGVRARAVAKPAAVREDF